MTVLCNTALLTGIAQQVGDFGRLQSIGTILVIFQFIQIGVYDRIGTVDGTFQAVGGYSRSVGVWSDRMTSVQTNDQVGFE